MSDPVIPPLPPVPYPGTLTDEQRRRLAELWAGFWSYLSSILYQPPPVPPPPTPPGPIAGDTLFGAAVGVAPMQLDGCPVCPRCGPVREAAAVGLLVLDMVRDTTAYSPVVRDFARRAGDSIRGALWSQP